MGFEKKLHNSIREGRHTRFDWLRRFRTETNRQASWRVSFVDVLFKPSSPS